MSSPLVGCSRPLQEAIERARRLSVTDIPILILGETGTGKELVARLVHRASSRGRQPFLPINCAALSRSLLLSDLFGHARGAFTGADRDRPGVFEAARSGTVLLDEIGDLQPEAQGKLLRVLQEGEVRRVGESRARHVDARVVAATHRDLAVMVQEGAFRHDLFFRLSVGTVRLPPLRDRGDDVLLLADHFLGRGRAEDRRRLSACARRALRDHDWPGNVRELWNVLAVASALAEDEIIREPHLDLPVRPRRRQSDYHRQVEDFRRSLIRDALVASGGNRAQAARRLGLSRQAMSYLARTLLS